MTLVSPTQSTLIALMICGAVFAASGLWILIKPQGEGGTAKVELFGLKFESSSAGILVFLVGAAFLALPLFVEPSTPPPAGAPVARGVSGPSAGAGGAVAVLLPAEGAREVEPNDHVHEAAQLSLGATASGEVDREDTDWFVVPLTGEPRPRTVGMRHLGGTGYVSVAVFDAAERLLFTIGSRSGAAYGEVESDPGDRLYLRVRRTNNGPTGIYEVFTRDGAAPE